MTDDLAVAGWLAGWQRNQEPTNRAAVASNMSNRVWCNGNIHDSQFPRPEDEGSHVLGVRFPASEFFCFQYMLYVVQASLCCFFKVAFFLVCPLTICSFLDVSFLLPASTKLVSASTTGRS